MTSIFFGLSVTRRDVRNGKDWKRVGKSECEWMKVNEPVHAVRALIEPLDDILVQLFSGSRGLSHAQHT